MAGRLAGKVAIITGAARGIGLATARLFGTEGGAVLITDLDGAAVTAAAEALVTEGFDARGLEHDVASSDGWAAVMDLAISSWGQIDVLVNNAAAFGRSAPLWETSLEEWQLVMRVNVEGVYLGMKLAIPLMRDRGGSIVNVSSILGKVAVSRSSAYCASKGGVTVLTKAAALECAEQGWQIRINSVHPGFVMKPALREPESADKLKGFAQLHPIGRLGEPEEIAETILFLATAPGFVTGAELLVDGGYTAH